MGKHIAILRGINVSGQKIIKMDVLKKQMEELNFKNVSTYIQSGNIIFETETSDKSVIAKQISGKIKQEYGFEVPVIVKNQADLAFALQNNPFIIKRNEHIDILHVTFLSGIPVPDHLRSIESVDYKPDEFFADRDIVYVCCPNGYGRTKLNNNFFESKLKLQATTRNWKTILKLYELIS